MVIVKEVREVVKAAENLSRANSAVIIRQQRTFDLAKSHYHYFRGSKNTKGPIRDQFTALQNAIKG